MISCTEFIPLYSEFFKFMENRGGHEAVVRYWERISDNSIGDKSNPHSLISFVEKYGFEGTWRYWSHTLTEEACDILRMYDPERKTGYSVMRRCPSKGMLLDMKHLEPYHDYCSHCGVLYPRVLEKYGITCEWDYSGIDPASCAWKLYMTGEQFLPEDMEPAPHKEVMDMTAEDNKYLHRDFHLSGDFALSYCGEKYGDNGVREFLYNFAQLNYASVIEDCKKRGMIAIKEKLEQVYETEEASDVLHTELKEDELIVTIDKSPVIEYMASLGQKPSKYYIEETRTVYAAIADGCDLGFELYYYNEDGGCQFRFFKRGF